MTQPQCAKDFNSRPDGNAEKSLGAEPYEGSARLSVTFAEPHSWWTPPLLIKFRLTPHSKALEVFLSGLLMHL